MTAIDNKTAKSSSQAHSDLSSRSFHFSTDCSPFLNWTEKPHKSVRKTAVVFRSLVATLRLKPALNDSLEAKAVKLLKSVKPKDKQSADAFVISLSSNSDESGTKFVQFFMVLISSSSKAITTAGMNMLHTLFIWCSAKLCLALVNADLIPQLINNLHPLSLSFAKVLDIHTCLIGVISRTVMLATPYGLYLLKNQDQNEDKAVFETISRQAIAPSEQYIYHLCVNRFSIVDGEQSSQLMTLLPGLLEMSLYYQPTMDFILHSPVFITVPSCLTFFENDGSIWNFLILMIDPLEEWNTKRGEVQEMGTTVLHMLRMEGIEDVIEEKLQNDQDGSYASYIVTKSIRWNNLQGMNLLRRA
ncbi:hypothetical protein BLNAU_22561 [Blattamonas nauphoetae]|uniref:Uncharacterized protein n=1 Tax=Blattamonas nauphoetae TaxID=2049346 RepID=A0ABQ9WSR3_9EUKA|nr:hypothetical protein BLNAU_22561 [Blattamonas nauphoetae]